MEDHALLSVFSFFCENSSHFLVVLEKNRVLYTNAKTKQCLRKSENIRQILPPHLVNAASQSVVKKIRISKQRWLIIRWHGFTLSLTKTRSLILLMGEDISEIETLRRHADMLGYIVTKVPGFVFWKDADLKLKGCNDNFAQQVGFNHPEDIVNLTDYDLPWDEQQTQKFIQDDQEILQTGLPKINIEEKQRQINGKDLFLLTSKVPLYEGDKVSGVLGIYVDITALKEAELELRAERDKAEAANRLKSDFIRNMEHDIRTPISGIYGMSQLLSAHKTIPSDIRSHLNDIAYASKELLDYCNGILDFTHVENGSRPVIQQPFSLKELVKSILKMQIPAAKLKKINFSLRYGKSTPDVVVGDAYRIQRVLINLISNAIKFTAHGHVKIRIQAETTTNAQREKVIQFTINDSGIGIPMEKINLIYEKFSKINPSNKGLYKGNGLGLKIVKQYVEEMGGDIAVKSKINRGTTFQVFLSLKMPLSKHILEGHQS